MKLFVSADSTGADAVDEEGPFGRSRHHHRDQYGTVRQFVSTGRNTHCGYRVQCRSHGERNRE